MKKYEFAEVILNPLKDNRETLAEMGLQGWELKAVVPLVIKEPEHCGYVDVHYGAYVFQREIVFKQ